MTTKSTFHILTSILATAFVCKAQNNAGNQLFNNTITHTIYINFPQPAYWNDLVNNKAYDDANDSSTYIPAAVIIDGNSVDSVGIQFKGNSSYYNYPTNKKPFTLSFDEYIPGQRYDSLKSINLNNLYQDPTFMREKLFLDFLQTKGLYAPRANYAKLYLNGTYWGLYLMVERVNKTFLENRFLNNGGNLFKGDGTAGACANLFYNTNVSNYYSCYELKTNTTANNWTDLQNLTYQINNTSAIQFRDSLETVMNTNSFLGSWAAYNLFVEFDSYPYRFVHNYYTYHNNATGKFDWITWDASTAFGLDVPGTIPSIEATSVLYITPLQTDRPLCQRMLADSIYRDTYLNFVCSFANNDFLPSVLNPKIDTLYNRIRNDVYADPLKMYSNNDFDNNVDFNNGNTPGLKSFISNRSTNVLAELNSLGYSGCPVIVASVNENTASTSAIVYPNPATNEFYIKGIFSFPAIIELYDLTGKKLLTENITSDNHKISVEGFAKGMYLYKVFTKHGNQTSGKIIIE